MLGNISLSIKYKVISGCLKYIKLFFIHSTRLNNLFCFNGPSSIELYKKTPHAHDDYLYNSVDFLEKGLVCEKGGMMDGILAKINADPSVGIVYPVDPGCCGWEGNYSYGKALIHRMGYKALFPDSSMNFPVGTMFWARTGTLKPLLDLNLQWDDYPEEPIPIDGSMLHALERIFGILPGLCGFRTVVTAVDDIAR